MIFLWYPEALYSFVVSSFTWTVTKCNRSITFWSLLHNITWALHSPFSIHHTRNRHPSNRSSSGQSALTLTHDISITWKLSAVGRKSFRDLAAEKREHSVRKWISSVGFLIVRDNFSSLLYHFPPLLVRVHNMMEGGLLSSFLSPNRSICWPAVGRLETTRSEQIVYLNIKIPKNRIGNTARIEMIRRNMYESMDGTGRGVVGKEEKEIDPLMNY